MAFRAWSRTNPDVKNANGNVLDEYHQDTRDDPQATINAAGALNKAINLTPFSFDTEFNGQWDEFTSAHHKTVDRATGSHNADDIIYGGLGSDWLHGGSGDDAVSGAEALATAYTQVYNGSGQLAGVSRCDYYRPFNPVDSLRYNPVDVWPGIATSARR